MSVVMNEQQQIVLGFLIADERDPVIGKCGFLAPAQREIAVEFEGERIASVELLFDLFD